MPRKRKEIPEGYNENFPQRLRELIKEKGETQQGLADYIGRTRQLISYYSDGSSSPDWKTLARIAEYFGVTSDYLIGLSDAKQAESADIVNQLGISEENINKFKELKADADEAEEDFPHVKFIQAVNEVISELFEHNIFTLYADFCNTVLSVDSEEYTRFLSIEELPEVSMLARECGLSFIDSVEDSELRKSKFITACNFLAVELAKKYDDILEEKKAQSYKDLIRKKLYTKDTEIIRSVCEFISRLKITQDNEDSEN